MNTEKIQSMSVATLALATALLLLIPLIAMQFTPEVAWSVSDFIIAGALLFGTGLAYLMISRKDQRSIYRSAAAMALISSLFLVWSNLAVGIIGSENNSINLLYFGLIAVGIVGAVLSRLQPLKLAITLFSMATAQLLITVIALLTGMQELSGSSITEILAVNGLFIILFMVSAFLFHKAALEQQPDQVNTTQKP